MKTQGDITLSRDCDAVQIPSGHPLVLPAGMSVVVTQSLGGTFTVATPGGLARIELKDADALGLDPEAASAKVKVEGTTEQAVWDQCLACINGHIPPAIGPSGRPLVYYHDKSIGKPAGWDNAKWRAVREVTTEHFIFYSIVPAGR